jgi:hypothetical protein
MHGRGNRASELSRNGEFRCKLLQSNSLRKEGLDAGDFGDASGDESLFQIMKLDDDQNF